MTVWGRVGGESAVLLAELVSVHVHISSGISGFFCMQLQRSDLDRYPPAGKTWRLVLQPRRVFIAPEFCITGSAPAGTGLSSMELLRAPEGAPCRIIDLNATLIPSRRHCCAGGSSSHRVFHEFCHCHLIDFCIILRSG